MDRMEADLSLKHPGRSNYPGATGDGQGTQPDLLAFGPNMNRGSIASVRTERSGLQSGHADSWTDPGFASAPTHGPEPPPTANRASSFFGSAGLWRIKMR